MMSNEQLYRKVKTPTGGYSYEPVEHEPTPINEDGFKFTVCFCSENQHTKDEIVLEVMKALRGFDEDCFIGISTDVEPIVRSASK